MQGQRTSKYKLVYRANLFKLEEHLWQQSLDKIETIDADLEIKKISSFKCESKENILEQILNRISSYHRVLRVTAYVLRAFNKIPASKNLCVSQAVEMPATELQHSFLFIVGLIQHQTYWKEIDCLKKDKVLSAEAPPLPLCRLRSLIQKLKRRSQ